uniref:Transmembrane protein 240b n=1 Tax=Mastacembelus armatus TaxID=205130 RepID=A0A7N8Y835_9TELE
MNALLARVYNFFLLLVRGPDHVCSCTCGRHQIYHVVPYHGAESLVDHRETYFASDIMTQQEMDVITGLLLGLCISWVLLWLDRLRLKYWTAKRQNVGFWLWKSKWIHPKNKEDSRAINVHIGQDLCSNTNGII